MAERLSTEEFRTRLASELARGGLVTLVAAGKDRRVVARAWRDKVTLTFFQGKKQERQETIDAAALAERDLIEGMDRWELERTDATLHARRAKRAILVSAGKPPVARAVPEAHDRARDLLLDPRDEGVRKLLHAIGLASPKGHVLPGREKKLRQVERFVRIALDVAKDFPEGKLAIVDAGCGAAYLTFALRHVLEREGYEPRVVGVDVREDVIAQARKVAAELGVSIELVRGTIRDAPISLKPDLVLSLHACDTATDEALARGVRAGAKAILAVPCCQHELHKKLEAPELAPLLRHGILRERLADLATDALRAHLLRASGYKTDVVEFVDAEATMKNVLIRAVAGAPRDETFREEAQRLKASLGITAPVALEELLALP